MVTRRLVGALVALDVLRDELRRYWRRLLVGALVGWCVASIVGAVAFTLLELELGYPASDVELALFVWAGIGAGALVAYSIRRERG